MRLHDFQVTQGGAPITVLYNSLQRFYLFVHANLQSHDLEKTMIMATYAQQNGVHTIMVKGKEIQL